MLTFLIMPDFSQIIASSPQSRDHLIMLLHKLQDAHSQNYLPEDTLIQVAKHMNLTLSSVYGVVKYYSMFSTVPRGRYIIRICESPVCNMLGSWPLVKYLEAELGIQLGNTTADGLFSLEITECLGQCANAPAMLVNRDLHLNLDEGRIREIIKSYRENFVKS